MRGSVSKTRIFALKMMNFAAWFLPGCMQMAVGNFIEPMVFGDMFDMHEVTVLAGLTLWSVLWGIPGAVLSVPIMVVILIILKTMKHPVATFLVGLMRGKFSEVQVHTSFILFLYVYTCRRLIDHSSCLQAEAHTTAGKE